MYNKTRLMQNIIGYWKLDESSGTVADSIGTNTGTVTGCDYSQTGKINNCLGFVRANSDHIVLASDTTLRFTTAFSVGAWIKTSSTVGTDNQFVIFGMYNASTSPADGWNLALFQDGKAYFSALDSSGTSYSKFSDAVIDDQNWHYVLAVWTGSVMQIYVDGVKSGSDVAMTNAPNYYTTHVPCIGCLNTYGTNYVHHFNGLIDEIAVWNRALDAQDAYYLYNGGNGLALPFNNLTLWLPMNEGSGTTVYDYSGNSNNGTLTNGPVWYKSKDGKGNVYFDGTDDYISVANESNFDFLTQHTDGIFSVCCLVKKTSTINADSFSVIWAKSFQDTSFYGTYLDVRANGVFNTGSYLNSSNYRNSTTGNTNMLDNNWHFVCVTQSNGYTTRKIYLDCVELTLTDSNVGTPTTVNLSTNFTIAKRTATQEGELQGNIKNFMVFTKALSLNEIKDLYKQTYVE